jgi:hypothetical protein
VQPGGQNGSDHSPWRDAGRRAALRGW